jgi:hypothetical protein
VARRDQADDALALAIAGGASLTAAAEACGVSRKTATRRMQEPDFRARVNELQGQMVNEAVGKMAAAMAGAADALKALVRSPKPAVRLGAAKAVLELAMKLRDTTVEQRLADLEARVLGGRETEP